MSHDVNKIVSLQLLVELNNLSSSSLTQSKNSQHQLTDELLSALNCVFHTCLHAALDIVDKDQVTLYQCPAGRSLYQVLVTLIIVCCWFFVCVVLLAFLNYPKDINKMLKICNKNVIATSLTLLCHIYCKPWTSITAYSIIMIANFGKFFSC